MIEEQTVGMLCHALAAHPEFPWRKGLVLDNGDVLMFNDNEESVDELRELGVSLEHPTTIGWMFTDLVARLAKVGGYVGLAHQLRGIWTVHAWDLQTWKPDGTGDARLLAESDKLGEALGRAWLASWENVA